QKAKYQNAIDELYEQVEQQKRLRNQAEKSRSALDQEKASLDQELSVLHSARSEAEKRRKQAEAALAELNNRLTDSDASRGAVSELLTKTQSDLELVNKLKDEAEQKVSALERKVASLEQTVAELQETVDEETRQKLSSQSRVRQLETELLEFKEQIEDLEKAKVQSEKDVQLLKQQLIEAKKKADEGVIQSCEEKIKKLLRDLESSQKQLTDSEVSREKSERARKKVMQEVV
uniref:Myosin_tail_1 domain-containing protein n=1 Tax=Steinernema glaseri TaxID=37863 RepID=A0A1I7YVZ5_9BILA